MDATLTINSWFHHQAYLEEGDDATLRLVGFIYDRKGLSFVKLFFFDEPIIYIIDCVNIVSV